MNWPASFAWLKKPERDATQPRSDMKSDSTKNDVFLKESKLEWAQIFIFIVKVMLTYSSFIFSSFRQWEADRCKQHAGLF